MLFLITIFCALFGLFKWVNAPGVVYFVSTLFVLVVGGAQMKWGESPRGISMGAGAFFLPIATGVALSHYDSYGIVTTQAFVLMIPVGALFGYIAGAVLAGFFLVSRMIDDWNDRDRSKPAETFTAEPPPPPRWTQPAVNAAPIEAEIIEGPAIRK